jgi:outer membrane protein OmpA-like peptidoglycan-associated protein
LVRPDQKAEALYEAIVPRAARNRPTDVVGEPAWLGRAQQGKARRRDICLAAYNAVERVVRSSIPCRQKEATRRRRLSEDHWIPLSDLMTGLMMVFMLIAVVFMIQVQAEEKKAEVLKERAEEQAARMHQIAVVYTDLREALYNDLLKEFRDDLPKWHAELDRDLSIRFKEPDILFKSGSSDISNRFRYILDDFFPRYLRLLSGPAYRESIEEVRIEGHTSSKWDNATSSEDGYMHNMELSQERTRSVFGYVLFKQRPPDVQGWLIARLTANGLSSSKLQLKPDGTEDPEASRRVEFRVRTNADKRLTEVLQAGPQ